MSTREYIIDSYLICGSENIAFRISIYVHLIRKNNNKRVQVLKGYFSQLAAERAVVCLKHHFAENNTWKPLNHNIERMLEIWASTHLVILFL